MPTENVSVRLRDGLGRTKTVQASTSWTDTPPPQPVLYGAGFGSVHDTSRYPSTVPVARLFPGGGYGTNIQSKSTYQQAKAKGATKFILDVNTTSDINGVGTLIRSFDPEDEVYMALEHEPERGSRTPAQWVSLAIQVAAATRNAGGIPCAIFTSSILTGGAKNGATIDQYALPAGTIDVLGFDLYPRLQTVTQAQMLAKWLPTADQYFHCDRIIVPEYGALANPVNETKSVNWIKEFQAWMADHGEAATYFSSGDDVFTAPRATAWFS